MFGYSHEYRSMCGLLRSPSTEDQTNHTLLRSRVYTYTMQRHLEHGHGIVSNGDAGLSKKRWSYVDFVRANPTGARTVESLLQYAGFFSPARLADRDIAIESGYAMASLAAMAHDRILLKNNLPPPELRGHRADETLDSEPGSSLRLGGQTGTSSTTLLVIADRMRVALSMLAHVQIVVEKIAGQHGGERRRRQTITYIESLKALCRLLLLACTREMVIGGGKYFPGGTRKKSLTRKNRNRALQRNDNQATAGNSDSSVPGWDSDPVTSTSRAPEVYTGKRSGVKLAVPPRARVVWARGGGAAVVSEVRPSKWSEEGDSRFRDRPLGNRCNCVCSDSVDSIGGETGCHGDGGGAGGGRVDGSGVPCSSGQTYQRERHHCSGCRKSRRGYEHNAGEHGASRKTPGLSQAWLMAGEVVNILRPLVYSHGCAVSGDRSWRPWLVSLGMDALAHACTTRAGRGDVALLIPLGGGYRSSGPAEDVPVLPCLDQDQTAELRRRKMLWLLYLMRSPAFELLAEPIGRGVAGVFEGVPLVGGLATYALTMLLYVQRHHFYISAS